ncbi:hypothetical protein M426DRAFT_24183 [Hypoxylon sp. CI-4A]|nr:hypothetical protein M426DRAFT_24183 [Hypoxylon sp. CI-4A]
MCYYQYIHKAHHYELLNLDAKEQECHNCEYQLPLLSRSDDGEECREVVFRCPDAPWDDKLCENAFGEDVFIPLISDHVSRLDELPPPEERAAMEFWLEGQPSNAVVTYMEDEVLAEEESYKRLMTEKAHDREMAGYLKGNILWSIWDRMTSCLWRRS